MLITLKAARVNAGLTQKELADKLDRSVYTIMNWETGKTKINVVDFKKVCEILKVDENKIFLS